MKCRKCDRSGEELDTLSRPTATIEADTERAMN